MTIKNEHNKINVPNLRFPEFQGEWEKCKLGELTTKVGSGSTPKGGNAVYTSVGHCFVRSQNVGMGYLILDDIAHIDDDIHKKHKATEINEDDVLLNITGASIGRTAIATKEIEGGNVNQHVCIIRANSKVSPKFLCNYIQTKKIQNYIQSLQTGGSREGLNFEQIRSFPISLPGIAEQSQIAQLLDKLNERIATQNKIIDKLQSLIKGIVDCTILRKEKNAIVGDVCSISEQIRAEANIDDIITVRLHGNGVCKSSAENLQLGATQYYRRRAGQLIYGKQNFHNGAIGIVPISLDNGITSKDIPSFDIDEMKCNSVYLLAQLQSPQYYKPAEALTTGTGSKRLKEETFLKLPIVLPNKREQDNIAVLIHCASMNLDHAKRLLELLSIQKQFLLRQMFI